MRFVAGVAISACIATGKSVRGTVALQPARVVGETGGVVGVSGGVVGVAVRAVGEATGAHEESTNSFAITIKAVRQDASSVRAFSTHKFRRRLIMKVRGTFTWKKTSDERGGKSRAHRYFATLSPDVLNN